MNTVPLLDHAAIGNGQVLALIKPSTEIQWLCMPRFDSPSVFASILDRNIGGSWSFVPEAPCLKTDMAYIENTNVLRTEVTTESGRYEVIDFAPRTPKGFSVKVDPEICRYVRPLAGSCRIKVHFDPKPDYARGKVEYARMVDTIEIKSEGHRFFLRSNATASDVLEGRFFTLDRPVFFSLSYGVPPTTTLENLQEVLDLTVLGWQTWARTCALPPFAQKEVLRSALCLKLHAFHETGAIIAAATTSIPEALGTERTWDYRYCWLRDAAFVVEALRRLSHMEEGESFVKFLLGAIGDHPLQPVYGITGDRILNEMILGHLEGYGGTRPVRVGNAAYLQKQNDLMGEIILCLDTILMDARTIFRPGMGSWKLIKRLVEEAIDSFAFEDTGIWEYRTQPRHYTFSKVLAWVSAHRGADLAAYFKQEEFVQPWVSWAEQKKKEILEKSYNAELGFFTQAFHGQFPDASNLLLPTLGIVDAKDPRFISTVRSYQKMLSKNGLVLRYVHDDDFGETTSAFSICSFWLVEALTMMGEIDSAIELFNRLISHANPVGLFSEDIEPVSGRLIGNFPQAYTHVGLINAAVTIGEYLGARDSRFMAWT